MYLSVQDACSRCQTKVSCIKDLLWCLVRIPKDLCLRLRRVKSRHQCSIVLSIASREEGSRRHEETFFQRRKSQWRYQIRGRAPSEEGRSIGRITGRVDEKVDERQRMMRDDNEKDWRSLWHVARHGREGRSPHVLESDLRLADAARQHLLFQPPNADCKVPPPFFERWAVRR